MKRLFNFAAGFAILAAAACNGGTGKQDSVDSAKTANDSAARVSSDTSALAGDTSHAMSAGPVAKGDADFAVKAANGGQEEVALGQLAQSNAGSQRVKDFAAMMVKDHTEAGDKLKALAQRKNIALPASLGDKEQKMVTDLQQKKGQDFDKAYMSMMLDDHKKTINDFNKASTDCKDTDLKSFATNTLPVLQKHLDSVKAITGKQ